jgi:vacuolar-type H+-ATPase subunit E/Vma4
VEELQSTEALDREILEDARKKAFKILKSADESAAASRVSWERRLSAALEEARTRNRLKTELGRREIMARLPMDKRRIRSEKIEGFLGSAMEDFLASLGRDRITLLLEGELIKRINAVEGPDKPVELRYRGLSKDELEGLIKKALPGIQVKSAGDALYTVPGVLPALVLEFPCLRLSASVDAAASQLLLDKRAELAAALLGEQALENPAGEYP